MALVLELDVLGHAVLAAEVTAVRDRDPEVIHLAVVAVGELLHRSFPGIHSCCALIVSAFRLFGSGGSKAQASRAREYTARGLRRQVADLAWPRSGRRCCPGGFRRPG